MSGLPPATGRTPVAYFTEVTSDAETLRLAAAVIWRGVPTRAALRGGGGTLGWLRGARHRLWLRLGPLGADVSVAGRPLFGGTEDAPRGVGSVGASPGDEPLAYYDEGSRTLRVLGRVMPAPRGESLVALVDATGGSAAAPTLAFRVVPTPEVPAPRFDEEPLAGGEGVSYSVVGEEPVWTAALRADPVVRTFLDEPGSIDGARAG
jgi:hypothetical protein